MAKLTDTQADLLNNVSTLHGTWVKDVEQANISEGFRDNAIRRAHAGGCSLRRIGAVVDRSAEWVRQVVAGG